MQELHLYSFPFLAKVVSASFTSLTVSSLSSSNLSTNFHSLNIHQHHMIYHIFTFTITRIPNKSFFTLLYHLIVYYYKY